MIGTTLSHYKIIEKLGQGGQGEVYLAEDSRLDRKVALKILPQHLSERAELRERFEREARAVSSLNHPHICTLYDIGEQDGIHYLVMEHLVGETLEARLAKGALSLEQTLEYAIQIADALDKAHRQGVVHRDLKPGNIMLVKSGAKLLDFGLAMLQAAETPTNLSALPTEQANLTAEGTILGTLQYMAPEQLEAKEADSRTDIFAFGAVVYEMATGKKAFGGKSQASLIGAIMNSEPQPMAELEAMTPRSLDHVVKRCLAKVPDDRWQSAADVVHELRWVVEMASNAELAGPSPTLGKSRFWMAATAVCLLVATAVSLIYFREAPPLQRTLRYTIPLPKEGESEGLYFHFNLSPDGQTVAVSGVIEKAAGIFTRELDSLEWRQMLVHRAPGDFFWSPDSRSIGFFDHQKLKKVSVGGGPTEDVADIGPGSIFSASGSWSQDDVIVFNPPGGGPLLSVPAAGGEPRPATTVESGVNHRYPAFLPDGQHFLYTSQGGSSPGIHVASLENPVGRQLLADPSSARFAPAASGRGYGHLIFLRDGMLMAQPFDPNALELRGDAFVLAERGLWSNNRAAAVSVSNNGILTYLGGRHRETDSRLIWVDRSGDRLAVEGPTGPPSSVTLSPDQRMAAVVRRQAGLQNGDVWLRDMDRGLEDPFTFEGTIRANSNVVWSPDGSRIAFSSTASESVELYISDVPASRPGEPIFGNGNPKVLTDWSRDGYLLYTEIDPETGADLWYLPLAGNATGDVQPVAFLRNKWDESFGQIAPNGQWIAYVSNETGSYEVYVQPFPSGAGKWRISTAESETGTTQQPRWSRDGSELFYLTGAGGMPTMMAAPMRTPASPGSSPVLSPRPLYEVRVNGFTPRSGTFFYSVSNDGERFLINQIEAATEPAINVVVNWEEAVLAGQ